MSYPELGSVDDIKELYRKKEFYTFKVTDHDFRADVEPDPYLGKYLKMHSHQLFVRNFMNPNTPYKRLHLKHATGTGKCHAKGTLVIMADKTLRRVEDVRPGDQLMGDDGTPRNVLSIARGREQMARVTEVFLNGIHGESFVCNKSHILSLVPTGKDHMSIIGGDVKANTIKDLPLTEVDPDAWKLYRAVLQSPCGGCLCETKVYEDTPYMLGMRACGTGYVPRDIVVACTAARREFLAAIVDHIGDVDLDKLKDPHLFITHTNGDFVQDIVFVARSVGFHVRLVVTQEQSHIMTLSGDKLNEPVPFLTYNRYTCEFRGPIDLPMAVHDVPAIYNAMLNRDIKHCPYGIQHAIRREMTSGMTRAKYLSLRSRFAKHFEQAYDVPTNGQFPPTYLQYHFRIDWLPVDDYYGFVIDGNHRYLLGDFTVTHNTLAAISIAHVFISMYRSTNNPQQNDGPSVFVLGFGGTKAAFVRELLRHTEFGFITHAEKEEMLKRQRIAESGLPEDMKSLRDYYSLLKRRLVNRARGGYYKFFGYDEFINRLFLSDTIKLTDLEASTTAALRAWVAAGSKGTPPPTLEDVIHRHIRDGTISVNTRLIKQFENSLLICDEIHNTYNMHMKNNRGVVIQYLLDTVPSLRFVSMSATPINNSPTEIVELINYLGITPVGSDYKSDQPPKVTKRDLFSGHELLPGALQKIGEYTRGKISFLQDANIQYFPERVFIGEDLILPMNVPSLGDRIPYLKFIICPMSEYHKETYERMQRGDHKKKRTEQVGSIYDRVVSDEQDVAIDDIVDPSLKDVERSDAVNDELDDAVGESHAVPADGYTIYDVAIPGPRGGIYRSSEINEIAGAGADFQTSVGISLKGHIVSGSFMQRDNLDKYSTKYAAMLDAINEIFAASGGDPTRVQKTMIYHDRVRMSGVLFIQEVLKANGILDEFSEPVDSTRCCVCGRAANLHGENDGHVFIPARFVIAHSDIDKPTMNSSLTKFNAPDNANGHKFMFLVGSKIIKESYDFKDIQNMLIMSLPVSIPTLIQVLGRAIRKFSHANLPPEQRKVNVRMFVTTGYEPSRRPGTPVIMSPEVQRYIDKFTDYVIIQYIERELNRNAVDADIHRDITMPPSLLAQYFPNGTNGEPQNVLGNLYFEPEVRAEKPQEIDKRTFRAYKYYDEEIDIITMIIKRLFMREQVWDYDSLWHNVRNPPFGLEVNPTLFDEDNFVIALNYLLNPMNIIQRVDESRLIDALFDRNSRAIYIDGVKHIIEAVDKYFIAFPVVEPPATPYSSPPKLITGISSKPLVAPNEHTIVDVETYARKLPLRRGVSVNVSAFVNETRMDDIYEKLVTQLIAMLKGQPRVDLFITEFSVPFQKRFLEEIIEQNVGKSGRIPTDLAKKIIGLMNDFGAIVYSDEVRKYRDVAAKFAPGGVPHGKLPIGYASEKTVRLYNPNEGWFEISKIALNRQLTYKENEIIIGYLESGEDHTKFKLRSPVQKIKAAMAPRRRVESGTGAREFVSDTRFVERGIVCSTKNKHDLIRIIQRLGISTSKLGDVKVKLLCEIIRESLIDSEIRERQKDSRYKYFYGWWDEKVPITAMV